jgi:hypothetical protein
MLNEAPSFASVACRIGEPRLERVLQALAVNVQNEIHNASFVSRRSDVRNGIKDLKSEALQFNKALDRVSKHFLSLPFYDQRSVRQAIHDVIEFCDKSLRVVSDKAGRGKEPGRTTCAMIVIEARTLVKGKPPGANNHKVHEICDEYWRACGNQTLGEPRNWLGAMADALANRSRFRRFIHDEIRGHEIAP